MKKVVVCPHPFFVDCTPEKFGRSHHIFVRIFDNIQSYFINFRRIYNPTVISKNRKKNT